MTESQEAERHSQIVNIFGASGFVGRALVSALLREPFVKKLKVFNRRPIGPQHLKVEEVILDFDHLIEEAEHFSGDVVICALGSTLKKAGSRESFFHVDYELVRKIARLSSMKGVAEFVLISSHGADPRSPFFYFQVKGQIEEEILRYPFSRTLIYRPSLLQGRTGDWRWKEKFVEWGLAAAEPLLKGSLANFRPTPISLLAEKVISDIRQKEFGKFIRSNRDILGIES